MITVRLDPVLENRLNEVAQQLNISKSELVRKSIIEFIDKIDQPTAWELGKDLFGKHSSGQGELSINRKALLKKKLGAKYGKNID